MPRLRNRKIYTNVTQGGAPSNTVRRALTRKLVRTPLRSGVVIERLIYGESLVLGMEDVPVVEYDFGIASIYVQGGEDESLQDVREAAADDLEELSDFVRELKEMDMDIQEEARERFPEDNNSGPGRTFG